MSQDAVRARNWWNVRFWNPNKSEYTLPDDLQDNREVTGSFL